MYYINAATSVTHQNTFSNKGFTKSLKKNNLAELIKPDYKQYINPVAIRRMSEILRMSVACGMDALKQAEVESADAIIVGTGLGCLMDTEKFLNNAITITGALLPPTSFIQSTHNTMAGQISLAMSNHNYNMTHTQNTLSFEHALLDAVLMLNENDNNILVGAADEYIKQLDVIAEHFQMNALPLTSGASFFVLSKEKNKNTMACVKDVTALGNCDDVKDHVAAFLSDNKISSADVDLVLHTGAVDVLKNAFSNATMINYGMYSGMYATSSAFALHMAADMLNEKVDEVDGQIFGKAVKNILICNNLLHRRLGLTLVQGSEA